MRRLAAIVILALTLAACGTEGVPRVTPTVAPSDTPSPTPEQSVVALQPSRTPLLTSTPTETATTTSTSTPDFTTTPEPSITPSASPTATNTPTDTPTSTATNTLAPSITPTATDTPTRTPTATRTSTNTPTATATITPSASATPSDTATSTATATSTSTPSITPLPTIGPTNTFTPTATFTLTPSVTASSTSPPPTATSTSTNTALPPTPDLTAISAQFTQTMEAFQQTQTAQAPTPTDRPSATPTNTLPVTNTPGPTLDATPTFVTAVPGTQPPDLGILPTNAPTAPADDIQDGGIPTASPSPAPTVAVLPGDVPATVAAGQFPPNLPPPVNTSSRAFALSTVGGIQGGGFDLFTNVSLFARNPADPSQYALTNEYGTLFFTGPGGTFRPDFSPFSRFEPTSREANNFFVSFMQWSPNGAYLAFIIDGDRFAPDTTDEDGIHIYNPATGQIFQILRDCPYEGHRGCLTGGARQILHESLSLAWSPDSSRVLVSARRTDPGSERGVLLVVPLGQSPEVQPPVLSYDYGAWTRDGGRIVVSGRNPAGRVILGTVNPDGSDEQVLLDAGALGLWVQSASQAPNGTIYALSRPLDAGGGPLRLIDQNGNPVTDFIGSGPPSRVSWSPDGSAVLVVAGGRLYVANINGTVQDITGSAGGSPVNWVSGGLPPSASTEGVPQNLVPPGVIEGSRYQPGQQLRVLSAGLNLRAEPNQNGAIIGGVFQGEWVAILAGPYNTSDGVEWWRIQTANRVVGWIAGEIGGNSTLGP